MKATIVTKEGLGEVHNIECGPNTVLIFEGSKLVKEIPWHMIKEIRYE